mmetsp:Transcript_90239/g.258217  ORF Transcript_90239/g.258217 Transcript_90239/m.258217 type:complete len:209 (+) Transcript_90239:163-789(+)
MCAARAGNPNCPVDPIVLDLLGYKTHGELPDKCVRDNHQRDVGHILRIINVKVHRVGIVLAARLQTIALRHHVGQRLSQLPAAIVGEVYGIADHDVLVDAALQGIGPERDRRCQMAVHGAGVHGLDIQHATYAALDGVVPVFPDWLPLIDVGLRAVKGQVARRHARMLVGSGDADLARGHVVLAFGGREDSADRLAYLCSCGGRSRRA